jgi:hypothetical protein
MTQDTAAGHVYTRSDAGDWKSWIFLSLITVIVSPRSFKNEPVATPITKQIFSTYQLILRLLLLLFLYLFCQIFTIKALHNKVNHALDNNSKPRTCNSQLSFGGATPAATMSAILSTDDLNDFISPGVACIKPVESLPQKQSNEVS